MRPGSRTTPAAIAYAAAYANEAVASTGTFCKDATTFFDSDRVASIFASVGLTDLQLAPDNLLRPKWTGSHPLAHLLSELHFLKLINPASGGIALGTRIVLVSPSLKQLRQALTAGHNVANILCLVHADLRTDLNNLRRVPNANIVVTSCDNWFCGARIPVAPGLLPFRDNPGAIVFPHSLYYCGQDGNGFGKLAAYLHELAENGVSPFVCGTYSLPFGVHLYATNNRADANPGVYNGSGPNPDLPYHWNIVGDNFAFAMGEGPEVTQLYVSPLQTVLQISKRQIVKHKTTAIRFRPLEMNDVTGRFKIEVLPDFITSEFDGTSPVESLTRCCSRNTGRPWAWYAWVIPRQTLLEEVIVPTEEFRALVANYSPETDKMDPKSLFRTILPFVTYLMGVKQTQRGSQAIANLLGQGERTPIFNALSPRAKAVVTEAVAVQKYQTVALLSQQDATILQLLVSLMADICGVHLPTQAPYYLPEPSHWAQSFVSDYWICHKDIVGYQTRSADAIPLTWNAGVPMRPFATMLACDEISGLDDCVHNVLAHISLLPFPRVLKTTGRNHRHYLMLSVDNLTTFDHRVMLTRRTLSKLVALLAPQGHLMLRDTPLHTAFLHAPNNVLPLYKRLAVSLLMWCDVLSQPIGVASVYVAASVPDSSFHLAKARAVVFISLCIFSPLTAAWKLFVVFLAAAIGALITVEIAARRPNPTYVPKRFDADTAIVSALLCLVGCSVSIVASCVVSIRDAYVDWFLDCYGCEELFEQKHKKGLDLPNDLPSRETWAFLIAMVLLLVRIYAWAVTAKHLNNFPRENAARAASAFWLVSTSLIETAAAHHLFPFIANVTFGSNQIWLASFVLPFVALFCVGLSGFWTAGEIDSDHDGVSVDDQCEISYEPVFTEAKLDCESEDTDDTDTDSCDGTEDKQLHLESCCELESSILGKVPEAAICKSEPFSDETEELKTTSAQAGEPQVEPVSAWTKAMEQCAAGEDVSVAQFEPHSTVIWNLRLSTSQCGCGTEGELINGACDACFLDNLDEVLKRAALVPVVVELDVPEDVKISALFSKQSEYAFQHVQHHNDSIQSDADTAVTPTEPVSSQLPVSELSREAHNSIEASGSVSEDQDSPSDSSSPTNADVDDPRLQPDAKDNSVNTDDERRLHAQVGEQAADTQLAEVEGAVHNVDDISVTPGVSDCLIPNPSHVSGGPSAISLTAAAKQPSRVTPAIREDVLVAKEDGKKPRFQFTVTHGKCGCGAVGYLVSTYCDQCDHIALAGQLAPFARACVRVDPSVEPEHENMLVDARLKFLHRRVHMHNATVGSDWAKLKKLDEVPDRRALTPKTVLIASLLGITRGAYSINAEGAQLEDELDVYKYWDSGRCQGTKEDLMKRACDLGISCSIKAYEEYKSEALDGSGGILKNACRLLTALEENPGKDIVYLGSGRGESVALLDKWVPKDVVVHCVDLQEAKVKVERFKYYTCSATAFDAKDVRNGAVWVSDVSTANSFPAHDLALQLNIVDHAKRLGASRIYCKWCTHTGEDNDVALPGEWTFNLMLYRKRQIREEGVLRLDFNSSATSWNAASWRHKNKGLLMVNQGKQSPSCVCTDCTILCKSPTGKALYEYVRAGAAYIGDKTITLHRDVLPQRSFKGFLKLTASDFLSQEDKPAKQIMNIWPADSDKHIKSFSKSTREQLSNLQSGRNPILAASCYAIWSNAGKSKAFDSLRDASEDISKRHKSILEIERPAKDKCAHSMLNSSPDVFLLGVNAAAKTARVREYVRRFEDVVCLFVTHSGALNESQVQERIIPMTMHNAVNTLATNARTYNLVAVDECFMIEPLLVRTMLAFAKASGAETVLLGDPYQGSCVSMPWNNSEWKKAQGSNVFWSNTSRATPKCLTAYMRSIYGDAYRTTSDIDGSVRYYQCANAADAPGRLERLMENVKRAVGNDSALILHQNNEQTSSTLVAALKTFASSRSKPCEVRSWYCAQGLRHNNVVVVMASDDSLAKGKPSDMSAQGRAYDARHVALGRTVDKLSIVADATTVAVMRSLLNEVQRAVTAPYTAHSRIILEGHSSKPLPGLDAAQYAAEVNVAERFDEPKTRLAVLKKVLSEAEQVASRADWRDVEIALEDLCTLQPTPQWDVHLTHVARASTFARTPLLCEISGDVMGGNDKHGWALATSYNLLYQADTPAFNLSTVFNRFATETFDDRYQDEAVAAAYDNYVDARLRSFLDRYGQLKLGSDSLYVWEQWGRLNSILNKLDKGRGLEQYDDLDRLRPLNQTKTSCKNQQKWADFEDNLNALQNKGAFETKLRMLQANTVKKLLKAGQTVNENDARNALMLSCYMRIAAELVAKSSEKWASWTGINGQDVHTCAAEHGAKKWRFCANGDVTMKDSTYCSKSFEMLEALLNHVCPEMRLGTKVAGLISKVQGSWTSRVKKRGNVKVDMLWHLTNLLGSGWVWTLLLNSIDTAWMWHLTVRGGLLVHVWFQGDDFMAWYTDEPSLDSTLADITGIKFKTFITDGVGEFCGHLFVPEQQMAYVNLVRQATKFLCRFYPLNAAEEIRPVQEAAAVLFDDAVKFPAATIAANVLRYPSVGNTTFEQILRGVASYSRTAASFVSERLRRVTIRRTFES